MVALDREGMVTTVNRAAERLLGGCEILASIGHDYREVFAATEFNEVRRVARDLLPTQLLQRGGSRRDAWRRVKDNYV